MRVNLSGSLGACVGIDSIYEDRSKNSRPTEKLKIFVMATDIRSIFKRSFQNSEFSFSKTGCHTKVEESIYHTIFS